MDMDAQTAGRLKTIDLSLLGTRVRNARLAKGLTQSQAAGSVVSTAYVCRIESGQRRPSGRLLEQIAMGLDTTLELLLIPGTEPDAYRLTSGEVIYQEGGGRWADWSTHTVLVTTTDHVEAALQTATPLWLSETPS